ncbi:hypothetical protein L3Q82_001288 [Scortum barcoo]|uniref:Uncharacterized protein n=1 Tax=Scortum barcoo TaxID=214431 RepID=A0ACB8W7E5_9TELE|nr:hypothetical protein L3Q82_001288 [Scortum barcoo]
MGVLRAVRSLYDQSRSLVRIAGRFHLCFLQMMLSCWLHQTRTFSMYWSGLQPKCEAAGMRISTSKSEAMVLDWKRVACPLQVGGEVLPQVEEFKYLGVL